MLLRINLKIGLFITLTSSHNQKCVASIYHSLLKYRFMLNDNKYCKDIAAKWELKKKVIYR